MEFHVHFKSNRADDISTAMYCVRFFFLSIHFKQGQRNSVHIHLKFTEEADLTLELLHGFAGI